MNKWMLSLSIVVVATIVFVLAGSRDTSAAATYGSGDFNGTLLLVKGGGGGGGHGGHGGHGGRGGDHHGSSRDGFEHIDDGEAHNVFRGEMNQGRHHGFEIENEFEVEPEIEIEIEHD